MGDPSDSPSPAPPVHTSSLSKPKATPVLERDDLVIEHANDAESGWYIEDEQSNWQPAEMAMVDDILTRTFQALETAGLDGRSLIGGYQFQRVPGEHIDEELGLVALVNHEEQVIRLADSAFLRLDGFYIYHELGHVVDRQMNRRLSDLFHSQAGEPSQAEQVADSWSTADGYWLRAHGHEDREEATADAFALWVGDQFGMKRPVFAGTPVETEYQQIIDQLGIAMVVIAQD